MQLSIISLFVSSALAASSVTTSFSTDTKTITSCDETYTECPVWNSSSVVPTYSGAAVGGNLGSYYAAGAAALAAGALLI